MASTKLLKAFCLVTVLFVFGTMLMGCGTSESKYVGTYMHEEKLELQLGKIVVELELKRDGTYRYEIKGGYGSVTTGEWRVIKEEGEEAIDFTPFMRLSLRKSREKGYYFIDLLSGDIYLKQK